MKGKGTVSVYHLRKGTSIFQAKISSILERESEDLSEKSNQEDLKVIKAAVAKVNENQRKARIQKKFFDLILKASPNRLLLRKIFNQTRNPIRKMYSRRRSSGEDYSFPTISGPQSDGFLAIDSNPSPIISPINPEGNERKFNNFPADDLRSNKYSPRDPISIITPRSPNVIGGERILPSPQVQEPSTFSGYLRPPNAGLSLNPTPIGGKSPRSRSPRTRSPRHHTVPGTESKIVKSPREASEEPQPMGLANQRMTQKSTTLRYEKMEVSHYNYYAHEEQLERLVPTKYLTFNRSQFELVSKFSRQLRTNNIRGRQAFFFLLCLEFGLQVISMIIFRDDFKLAANPNAIAQEDGIFSVSDSDFNLTIIFQSVGFFLVIILQVPFFRKKCHKIWLVFFYITYIILPLISGFSMVLMDGFYRLYYSTLMAMQTILINLSLVQSG